MHVGPAESKAPVVVFALAREAMYFHRRCRRRRRVATSPCPTWRAELGHRPVLVLEAGAGRSAMEAAVSRALSPGRDEPDPCRPEFLVLAGFSGALADGVRVGDVLLATEVVDEHGGLWPASWPPGGLAEIAAVETGKVLTADSLVAEPEAKRRLHERFAAVAVDMESAVAARLCAEARVPFGCLRAVSDDVDTALSPELLGLLRGGSPSPRAVLGALLRRPPLARELFDLARNTRAAARRLAAALDSLLRDPGT